MRPMSDFYSLTPPVATLTQYEQSPLLVVPKSSLLMRRRVEKLGRHFKHEMHTDFPPYEATEVPGVYGCIPYEAHLFFEPARDLWVEGKEHQVRFIGVACFRRQEWESAPACWSLDWVWFHPYFRRCAHLSGAWPKFKARYGEFHITRALCAGMESFLAKHNTAT